MKKLNVLLSTLACVLGLCACAPKEDPNPTPTPSGSANFGLGQIGSCGLDTVKAALLEEDCDYSSDASECGEVDGMTVFFCPEDASTFSVNDYAEGCVLFVGVGFSGKGAGTLGDFKVYANALVANKDHFSAIYVLSCEAKCRGASSDQLLEIVAPAATKVLYATECFDANNQTLSDIFGESKLVDLGSNTAADFSEKLTNKLLDLIG